ncbi:hypothetical protein I7I48_00344 [Histoplasma ohiense]|nr:hypothetical protein I7I48_00344 [Histoplasma ohiense (nom. inval.)]
MLHPILLSYISPTHHTFGFKITSPFLEGSDVAWWISSSIISISSCLLMICSIIFYLYTLHNSLGFNNQSSTRGCRCGVVDLLLFQIISLLFTLVK